MQTQLYGKPTDSIMSGAFENGAIQSEASWWEYYKMMNGGIKCLRIGYSFLKNYQITIIQL